MSVLDLLLIFSLGSLCREVLRSERALDIISAGLVGFFRDTRGIGTQVCDETDGAVSLYIHALIELLGKLHGLLR